MRIFCFLVVLFTVQACFASVLVLGSNEKCEIENLIVYKDYAGIDLYFYNSDFYVAEIENESMLPQNYKNYKYLEDTKVKDLVGIYGIELLKLTETIRKDCLEILYIGQNSILVSDVNQNMKKIDSVDFRRLGDKIIYSPSTKAFIKPVVKENDPVIDDLVSHVCVDSVTSYIQKLQDFGTRYAYAENRREVALWIKNKFIEFGYENARLDSFYFEEDGCPSTWQYNVEATIVGTEYPDLISIIGGHHDSISNHDPDPNPMVSAPGVDDNGSGTSGVLETARVMKMMNFQPKKTIRFVTFAAEEVMPLVVGSNNYVNNNVIEKNEFVTFYLNLDMIAYNTYGNNEISSMPYTGYEIYHEIAKEAVNSYSNLTALDGCEDFVTSDMMYFYYEGIPCSYYFDWTYESYPFYHTSFDIIDNIDLSYGTEAVKSSTALMALIDKLPPKTMNLNVINGGDGSSVKLMWRNIQYDDFHFKVRVYDSENLVGEYDVSDSIHLVTNLENSKVYDFLVSTIDNDNNEGAPSKISCLTTTFPNNVENLKAVPHPTEIELKWNHTTHLNFSHFNIYKYNEASSEYILLTQSTELIYIDNDCNLDNWNHYKIEAENDLGFISEPVYVSGNAMTMDKGVLVIDDSKNSGNSLPNPNDNMQDEFFDYITSDFNFDQYDIIENDNSISINDYCKYSSVIWHRLKEPFGSFINCEKLKEFEHYLLNGGNLLILTNRVSDMVHEGLNITANDSFMRNFLKIDSLSYNEESKLIGAKPEHDYLSYIGVDPEKAFSANNYHLNAVEVIYPIDEDDVLFKFDSEYDPNTNQGSMLDKPIGVKNLNDTYNTVTLNMPLYFFDKELSKELMHTILSDMFGEQVGLNEENFNKVNDFTILGNYPNPFNPETTIRFNVRCSANFKVSIYNIAGEKLEELLDQRLDSGTYNIRYDGSNFNSGVYFYRIESEGYFKTGKMLLVK
ncbi:MAG: M20/M25/M40 family metallo-hydrolase [Candidatus Delongbacteria bacterium]|nr:M20/M25/M40 family metallo-hydrolase [Candidatus Delongbacteria bacterium]MBN2837100.1 M20/M25/M40 family metallo-hydrolase [Candidatus Delongbacteria bacterium]